MLLPQELMIQILIHLPVKSLLQYRTVCKAWKTLISTPQFINSHLRLSTATASINPTVLITLGDDSDAYLLSATNPQNPVTLTLPPPPFHEEVEVVGSANGIICLTNLDDVSVSLWNPCTNRYKRLPKACDDPGYNGFGFDPYSGRLMFVKITCHEQAHFPVGATLYNVDMDHCREIKFSEMDHCREIKFSEERVKLLRLGGDACLCCKGILYFISWNATELILFDLHKEVIGVTPSFPSPVITLPCGSVLDRGVDAIIYKDCVAVILCVCEGLRFVTSLWALDDDGVSWYKKFSFNVDHVPMPRVHYYFSTTGQFLLTTMRGELVLYDREDGVVKDVRILGDLEDLPVRTFDYIESLVSIQGSEQLQ